ncbi:MAG: ISKra4 family transposase [Anaerolineaceae bacterium]|nr:ISKra4 family transposase [Anaerolineaceae bacterium]
MNDTIQLEEMLGKYLAGQLGEPESMSGMEQTVRKGLQELGRGALEKWLRAEGEKEERGTVTCQCGAEAKYVRRRKATLRTVLGKVNYQRSYYICPACGRGIYPLDERLGLRPNTMSGELERLAGMMGIEHPFEQGSRLFEELMLISLSNHSLDKAAQAYGEEQIQQEAEWEAEAYDLERVLEQRRTGRPPRRLYGAVDGGRVHIRGEEGVKDALWRELKVGTWFTTRAQPPTGPNDQWSIRAENVSYYADICEAKDFGRLMWTTGFQHQVQLANELIILGDGARWIWDLVSEHFPQAIQIVDWFHACEYLDPVAKAAFRNENQRQEWVKQTKTALWKGQLDDVIDACQQQIDPQRDDDPAQKAVTYFTNNRQRMDYPTYRANGYQIGSGTIESGIKQIATQRMKVAGAFWNLESARKVAKARAAYLSGQWNDLASQRSHLSRAA